MTTNLIDRMSKAIGRIQTHYDIGRITNASTFSVEVSGFASRLRLGDRLETAVGDTSRRGEVIEVSEMGAKVRFEQETDGIMFGQAIKLLGPRHFSPDESWIGRVIDPFGQPLDGNPLLHGDHHRNHNAKPPAAGSRRPLGKRLETGLAVFNTLLPLVRGQRIGLFAGSGVGKSTLLGQLARFVDADVVVIALVGERGREVGQFVNDVLGADGMSRSIVVAATSDSTPDARYQCALSATSIAEHFRDNGKHVLLLCDSVTRFCEAHREVSIAAGERADLRGFPASTPSNLANLCERAGPGADAQGDITAVYTVLVAGSDMEEPVADMLRGILDGHVVLDRAIAEASRFPAVDVVRSVSRSLPDAADAGQLKLLSAARRYLSAYQDSSMMIRAGLYEPGTDSIVDEAIECRPMLEKFLALTDGRSAKSHFAALKQALDHVKSQTVSQR